MLYQIVEYIGRNKCRKAGAQADILDAQIQHIDEAHGNGLSHGHGAADGLGHAHALQLGQELGGDGAAAEDLPVDVAAGEEDLMVHLRAGQVGDEHTEGNGDQQQGFELLHDGQVHEGEGDHHHDKDLPVPAGDAVEARILNEIHDSFHLLFLPAYRP